MMRVVFGERLDPVRRRTMQAAQQLVERGEDLVGELFRDFVLSLARGLQQRAQPRLRGTGEEGVSRRGRV